MDIYEEPDIDDGMPRPEPEIRKELERQFPKAMEVFGMLMEQLAAQGVNPQLRYKEGDHLIGLRGETGQFGAVIPKKSGICLLRLRLSEPYSDEAGEKLRAAGLAATKLKSGRVVLTITEDILKTHAQLITNEVRSAAESRVVDSRNRRLGLSP